MLLELQTAGETRFPGIVAHFYSIKTKKTPIWRVALNDWLEWYRVGIFFI